MYIRFTCLSILNQSITNLDDKKHNDTAISSLQLIIKKLRRTDHHLYTQLIFEHQYYNFM